MKRSLILSLILSSPVFAGWRLHDIPERKIGDYHSPQRVSMCYYGDNSGYKTFPKALEALKSQGKINLLYFMRPSGLTDDPLFQKEMIEAFKELAPKEWNEAEKSSGNMHNPKMLPLRKHLSKAFMKTTLAKQLSKDLSKYGLQISEFGQEKLRYQKTNEQRMIQGIFHVGVTPIQVNKGTLLLTEPKK